MPPHVYAIALLLVRSQAFDNPGNLKTQSTTITTSSTTVTTTKLASVVGLTSASVVTLPATTPADQCNHVACGKDEYQHLPDESSCAGQCTNATCCKQKATCEANFQECPPSFKAHPQRPSLCANITMCDMTECCVRCTNHGECNDGESWCQNFKCIASPRDVFMSNLVYWELVNTINTGRQKSQLTVSISYADATSVSEKTTKGVSEVVERSSTFSTSTKEVEEMENCSARVEETTVQCAAPETWQDKVAEKAMGFGADLFGKMAKGFRAGRNVLQRMLGRRLVPGVGVTIAAGAATEVLGATALSLGDAVMNQIMNITGGGSCNPKKLINEFNECMGTSVSETKGSSQSDGSSSAQQQLDAKTKEAISTITKGQAVTCEADVPAGSLWQLKTTAVSARAARDVTASLCVWCWTPDNVMPTDPPGEGVCRLADCSSKGFNCGDGHIALVKAAPMGSQDVYRCGSQSTLVECKHGSWQVIDNSKAVDNSKETVSAATVNSKKETVTSVALLGFAVCLW